MKLDTKLLKEADPLRGIRCEAMAFDWPKGAGYYKRCRQLATQQLQVRNVCWLHAQAARNPHRREPLRFCA